MNETDIYYWINCISKLHDEWTNDIVKIAIELVSRENIAFYNENSKQQV